MAFNSWDKLSKAQRDYPKTKFAVAVVDKALKKNPKNPFIRAWRWDLSLRLNQPPDLVLLGLQATCELPDLTDTRLLSYLYQTCAEASRRSSGTLKVGSIGTVLLKPWQNAAKALGRKQDRLGLWDALFTAAMREDFWEDVRFAVVNYNKEGPPSKKLAHYTHILAVQLAAEQNEDPASNSSRMCAIQFSIARKLMKQAYEASPDDPIAVKDIRDLRFMAEIFRRQGEHAELFELWDNPPISLKKLLRTHRDDLISLKTRLLRDQEDWPLLETHCHDSIEEVISFLNLAQDSKSLWELCAWRWDLWSGLMEATAAIRPGQERSRIIHMMDRCFGSGFKAKDRPLRITYMSLRGFIRVPMLSDCQEYWEHHSGLPVCFTDLSGFVQGLPLEDRKAFHKFITDRTRDMGTHQGIDEDTFKQWQQAEQNVLKFDYLLTVSLPEVPTYKALENFIIKVTAVCSVFPDSPDAGFLAVYALLNLHHKIVRHQEGKVGFEMTTNARVLLQATMLARHMVARDKNKQNRALALLATRLHLNMGLGKCAFQLYSHTKCKEMLLDTLSPYVLSRISMAHPFDVGGYQGFSADYELAKVIGTIERMEQKTDSYLFTDLQSFVWDQAVDALDLKRKLNSSLTKHICITERRRIARLIGESTDDLPSLNFKAHNDISDNVDRSVFPSFESTASDGPLSLVMPRGIPDKLWLAEEHCFWETASRVLYREGKLADSDPWESKALTTKEDFEQGLKTASEKITKDVWVYINVFVGEMSNNGVTDSQAKKHYEHIGNKCMQSIHVIRKAMEKLRMPGSTGLKPEDEPTMFHESMLICCYTNLEMLRALNKLIDHLREKVFNAKSTHGMKKHMPKNWIADLASETHICYESIRDVAQSYIHLIRTRGEAAIKAQVRWGHTGSALEALLDPGDVNYYANEYVESALEAWNGVMKVKLK